MRWAARWAHPNPARNGGHNPGECDDAMTELDGIRLRDPPSVVGKPYTRDELARATRKVKMI
jgi:hypothetical protein